MSGHVHWCAYVMSAIMVHTRVDVLYVVDQEYLMHIIVRNVQFKKKM